MKSVVLKELCDAIEWMNHSDIVTIAQEIKRAKRIFVWGLGRSGLVGRAFAIRLCHLGKQAYFIGDLCPPISAGDLLLIISSSGKKKMLFPPITAARKAGGRILSVTTGENRLRKVSDAAIALRLPSSVQFAGSLFEQAAFILLEEAVHFYRKKQHIPFSVMEKNHANWE